MHASKYYSDFFRDTFFSMIEPGTEQDKCSVHNRSTVHDSLPADEGALADGDL